MKQLEIIVGCLAVIALTPGQGSAQHYYGGGREIPLKVDSTMVMLKFDAGLSSNEQQTLLASIDRIVGVVADDHTIDEFFACSLSTGVNYDSFQDSIRVVDGVYLVEPYYLNRTDSAFMVGARFCVAFDEGMTKAQIDKINTSFGVVIGHEVAGMPNVFVLRNTDSSGHGLLDLANTYYELEETRYSHPEFGVWYHKQAYKLYDYYNEFQPHTKKVIGDFNQASVWDFAGLTNAITVAVLDDGVAVHEDLPAGRVLEGWDFAGEWYWDSTDNDNDPVPGDNQAHGMACAGIIAASHTTDSVEGLQSSSGMISLNPAVRILPIRIFDDHNHALILSEMAAAITYAYTRADVLSNSWAYPFSGPGPDRFDIISAAIEDATILGRDGRGCPVIFASGNDDNDPEGVWYPAWLPSAFSVGAVQLDDVRWDYSCYGSGLDIVAPSGDWELQGDLWSLDQMGNLGWNPAYMSDCPSGSNDNDYDCHFGGTSAACPVVSGTAALLLSRDPDMPVLSDTSDYSVYGVLRGSAVTDLEGGAINPPDNEYGYGRVDAYRAILSIARGDANNNGVITIGDVSLLLDHEFINGAPIPVDSLLGDISCDGDVTMADISILIDHLFVTQGPLPLPCFEFND